MNLSLFPISSPIPSAIKELYENAFPAHERRAWEQQQQLVQHGNLQLLEIQADDIFTGFVFYWQLNGFVFIEHFAIVPFARRKGTGSNIMLLLADTFDSIVLETEPAETSIDAARRIKFYEKLGYTSFKHPYLQPPYLPASSYHAMQLMFLNLGDSENLFAKIKHEIYTRVYGIFSGE